MSVQKSDQRERTVDPERIREVVDLTRSWWGVGEDRKLRQLGALAADAVLQALQAGERVQWEDWSIRTTPPRRIVLPLGESEWAAGIIAVSVHGLVSELRLSPDGVHRLCLRIANGPKSSTGTAGSEPKDRSFLESELED